MTTSVFRIVFSLMFVGVCGCSDSPDVPVVWSDLDVSQADAAGHDSVTDGSAGADSALSEVGADGATDVEPEITADAVNDGSVDILDTSDSADVPVPFACEGAPQVTNVTPVQLNAMLADKDFTFINVHIPYAGEIGATDAHIAYTDIGYLEAELGSVLEAKAVLYCLTGPMSASATKALAAKGYCRIYDLPGGMVGWQSAGYSLK